MNFIRTSVYEKWRLWIALSFVFIAFLLGGSSRSDTLSLAFLWPISCLAIGISLWTVRWPEIRQFPATFAVLGAATVIVALQLIPLPPSIWQSFPGRGLATTIATIAGMQNEWRPLSLTPHRTLTSLYALLVPIATALLLARCSAAQRQTLLIVVISVGLASGLLGLMQSLGSPAGPLYFYRTTSNGYAVGLLANRNHQAFLLAAMLPCLAALASMHTRSPERAKARARMAAIGSVFLIPLILVTGSRAGIALMIVALAFAFLLYSAPKTSLPAKRSGRRLKSSTIAWGLGIPALVVLTLVSSRATSISRLFGGGADTTDRLSVWPPIVALARDYFPFGSGAGSFVEIYQIAEPENLLAKTYLNHAHNDWLEVVMTMGLPGALLLLAAVVLWAVAGYRIFTAPEGRSSPGALMAQAGLAILALIGLASIVDYPARTPAIACLAVIAAMWAESGARRKANAPRVAVQ